MSSPRSSERRVRRMKIPPLKPSPYVENNSSNCKENATNISLSNNNKENSRLNTTPQDKLGIPRRYNSSPLRRSVLRPGETIESLFRVDPHESSPDYRSLCQDLVHHHADQPSMWRQVLKQATERANQDESKGPDLIRLHRRATSRFADAPAEQSADVAALWLSFAQALGRHGSTKDARFLFKHLQTQHLCQDQAELYCSLAELEEKSGNKRAAQQALQAGLEKGAEPKQILQQTLENLSAKASPRSRNNGPKRKVLEEHVSPKRQRTERGFVETASMSMISSNAEVLSANRSISKTSDSFTARRDSKESIRFQLAPLSRRSVLERDHLATPPAQNDTKKTTPLLDASTKPSTSLLVKSSRLAATARARPPLLSKALASKTPSRGSLGKPERVDPSQSRIEDDSEEDEEERTSPIVTHEITKKPKLTKKFDLSYMMAWDPEKKLSAKKPATPSLGKIEESQPACTESSHSNTSKSSHSNDSSDSAHKGETPGTVIKDQSSGESVNPDFVPLVRQGNMLRVNGSFYAKLGVIGRGGSCKVYRALSKGCQVLAIKKVKLAGMDKRSIAGYSNEIALLQRLRGNSSIIQLFDSQVDLERKAIFLVMEPGEVDLNHVLQQQQHAQQLNRHFIRLTWQQMLSAVHSIHEERIIHGDLKPANFLFVRGALKLIDFGIAKAIQSDDTTNIYRESQIGTLNYMSPEAILEDSSSSKGRMKLGRASDIWSLGCILYQMVYGRTPFAELHMIPKLQAIVNPNHEINYGPIEDMAAVDAMKQCLKRKPEDRAPIVGRGGLLNEHRFLHA